MTTSVLATPTTAHSVDRATATLVTAFGADPVIRWLYPAASGYLTYFPELVGLVSGQAFAAGTADGVEDGAGAALWLPPDAHPDEDALVELLGRSVDPDRHEDVVGFLGQMAEHHPTQPCWHLPFIGVDPSRQGQGLGSMLLERGAARCDRDHLPAYLEASTPGNRALYERHGFTVVGEIRTGDSPPLWPMLRPPADRRSS
ncbi:GNAT family N-acetyltransferase [soil metagenome]